MPRFAVPADLGSGLQIFLTTRLAISQYMRSHLRPRVSRPGAVAMRTAARAQSNAHTMRKLIFATRPSFPPSLGRAQGLCAAAAQIEDPPAHHAGTAVGAPHLERRQLLRSATDAPGNARHQTQLPQMRRRPVGCQTENALRSMLTSNKDHKGPSVRQSYGRRQRAGFRQQSGRAVRCCILLKSLAVTFESRAGADTGGTLLAISRLVICMLDISLAATCDARENEGHVSIFKVSQDRDNQSLRRPRKPSGRWACA